MPEGYGILVAVDGSAESHAVVRWATREAILRDAPITLLHVVAPVDANWPMGPMQANITEWHRQNAGDVIEQARKTLFASRWANRHPNCASSCGIRTLCRR